MATVSLQSDDNEPIYIEVEDRTPAGGLRRAGGGEGEDELRGAPATLEQALDRIRPIANAVIRKIRSLDVTPDELEVKFGVKLSVDANVIISKTAAEANFEFKLLWKRAPEAPPPRSKKPTAS
jgi:hypothetical protein